ncbi:LysR family transcriptional regulator [Agaribacterium sp. ZY112]|uniref:LysR family transcriptional regulator n=1 Tax=Agaribacterium sp. ZY112 TaxID=3233574 RepID=UPI003525A965
MNIDTLRTFLEVAKTRHFGHAAENLYLTQSAVSSRIKQLESLIGATLFIRQRNNILLTSAGERLLPHAENLLAGWQLAIQEAGVPTKQNTQISIGGTSNLWDTFLQSLLPRMASQFPNLYIRTEINNPQHLVRSLLGNRVDLFAALETPANSDIESQVIGELELIMVCNCQGRHIEDVPKLGHVFVDWGTAFNLQQARLFQEPVAPVLHTGQSHIALEFILSHKGAAFLPRALVEAYLESESLYQVEDSPMIKQQVFAVYKRGEDKSLSLGPIITMLQERDIKPDSALATLPLSDNDW